MSELTEMVDETTRLLTEYFITLESDEARKKMAEFYHSRAALIQRIEALENERRWIPVSERLPEFVYDKASASVEVLYRYIEIEQAHYYRQFDQRYWKDYGWVYECKCGETVSFGELGFVVDYWRYVDKVTITPPLPQPPEEGTK